MYRLSNTFGLNRTTVRVAKRNTSTCPGCQCKRFPSLQKAVQAGDLYKLSEPCLADSTVPCILKKDSDIKHDLLLETAVNENQLKVFQFLLPLLKNSQDSIVYYCIAYAPVTFLEVLFTEIGQVSLQQNREVHRALVLEARYDYLDIFSTHEIVHMPHIVYYLTDLGLFRQARKYVEICGLEKFSEKYEQPITWVDEEGYLVMCWDFREILDMRAAQLIRNASNCLRMGYIGRANMFLRELELEAKDYYTLLSACRHEETLAYVRKLMKRGWCYTVV